MKYKYDNKIEGMQFYKLTWLFKEMQDGNNK